MPEHHAINFGFMTNSINDYILIEVFIFKYLRQFLLMSALALTACIFSTSTTAQTIDLSKLKETSDATLVEFTELEFKDNVAEVTFQLVSNSTVYSLDVKDPTDIYKISATAHKPIGIVLNANQIELNNKNQATSRKLLLRDYSRGLGDRTAVLPYTTFKPGRIYIGLAPVNPVDVTLRVERIPPVETPDTLGARNEKATATGNDVANAAPGSTTSCIKPALMASGEIVDLSLVTAPKAKTSLYIYDKEGKTVVYKGAHEITGLRVAGGSLCIVTSNSDDPVGWRLLAQPSEFVDVPTEPNHEVKQTSASKLSIGDPFVMPLDSPDKDSFGLSHLSSQLPMSVRVRSAVPVNLCLYQSKKVYECFEGRDVSISPFSLTQDMFLSVENRSNTSGLYELTLETVDVNPNDTVFEPNRGADFQPLIEGAFRIEGQLGASDDVDTIGFDAGDSSQLWRIRVLGESVNRLYVKNPRGNIAEASRRHAGSSITTPDFYLEPGPAFIQLSGTAGDYKVIAKPLGRPRDDSEREPNDDLPRRITFGETVTGVLSEGEYDGFSLFLPKDATINISLDAPAGSQYNLGLWAASKQSSEDLKKSTVEPGGWSKQIRVPAGEHKLTLRPRTASPAEYRLSVDYSNPFQTKTAAKIDMSFRNVPDIRAYSLFRQRITAMLDMENMSNATVSGRTESWFARPGIVDLSAPVSLKAGEKTSIPVSFILPDDIYGGELPFFTALKSDQGENIGSVRGTIKATAKAQPVNRRPAVRVPPKLLGGINVAHAGLGAKWIETDGVSIDESGDYENGNPSGADDLPALIDGYISPDYVGYLSKNSEKPLAPVLDLPGENTIPIAGVGINTRMVSPWSIQGFAIDVSSNGRKWQEVLNTTHEVWGETAYYPFLGGAVEAKYIRFRATDRRGDKTTPIGLNGFEVIAAPGRSGLKNLNISTIKLGALVTGQKNMRPNRFLQIDEDNKKIPKLSGREDNPTEFNNAISFRNQLEAEIEAVEFTYPKDLPAEALSYKWAQTAIVSASPKGSAGPFREIGRLDLPQSPQPGQAVRLDLPEWTPAKAVKVEYVHDDDYYFHPPLGVRVIERPESKSYKSVLGTWGERATSRFVAGQIEEAAKGIENKSTFIAVLEELRMTLAQMLSENGDEAHQASEVGKAERAPTILQSGEGFEDGLVEFESRTETWRVKVEGETNTVTITARGSAGFDPTVVARDSKGQIVEPIDVKRSDFLADVGYTYPVNPGSFLDVEVSEFQRSTVFLFDQSSSVSPYIQKIRRAIVDFASDIVVGRDAILFKSFGGDWARENWFSDPEILRPALANYKGGSNSDGESALIDAADLLTEREGSRAIVIITDGDVGAEMGLVESLHESRARVFVVKIPSSNSSFSNPGYSQPITSLWAGQTGGEVSYVLQSEDISVAYARAAARLLGPKPYSIRAETEVRVLEPGFLIVETSAEDTEEKTSNLQDLRQLIILDASGSMLKRLEEGRRINIAKTALNKFLSSQLARVENGGKVQLGLRIFGGEPQSCETDLVKPVSDFDPEALESAIDRVRPQNNAKTAIGAALEAAGRDLETVPEPASILLITDGEETCGGDPLEAIRELRERGIKSRIDVVSFALEPEVDRRPFESWAKAGGGLFVDAETGDDLTEALARSTQLRFSVFLDEELIASGASGDEKIELESGQYDLRIKGQESQKIIITPSKTTRVRSN
jgi:Mg-chelatase subunit ChlD